MIDVNDIINFIKQEWEIRQEKLNRVQEVAHSINATDDNIRDLFYSKGQFTEIDKVLDFVETLLLNKQQGES